MDEWGGGLGESEDVSGDGGREEECRQILD